MDLGLRVEAASGPLPTIAFRWDAETEILAGCFSPPDGRGLTGALEFEGPDGAVLTVDVERGVVCGVEVVVWPAGETGEQLAAPAGEPARVVIPARPSQPGIGAVEIETPLAVRQSADGRTIHLRIGTQKPTRTLQLADTLLLELDRADQFAGFWLLDVPPFPEQE